MEEQRTNFAYHNIELYKSESLGSGAYGGVCKAKCDGLLCAAKIMHPTLFNLHDPGTASYLRKFREECHLLSLARHPNVVQYLGTYTDPDTRLPVLLMELCDESLTSFLERSPGPLSYHVQVNICHDIALALVYLHSNGLIHRDLTGNNVLMIAGTRAKITDFGMSKLTRENPRVTAFTTCPGNAFYMPPEALDEAQQHTTKLDVFSFGVLVIQILTKLFPNPTDRFRIFPSSSSSANGGEDEDEDGEVRRLIPDSERRATHLQLIPDTHSLKPLALQCLKKRESLRPSALQLSERLSELKQSSQYTESTQSSCDANSLQSQIQELQRMGNTEAQKRVVGHLEGELRAKESQVRELRRTIEAKETQISARDREIQAKDRQVLAQGEEIRTKDWQLQEGQQAIAVRDQALERKDREMQQNWERLRASEQLVSQFQQIVEQKDRTIADLQRTISEHERKIPQLEQQDPGGHPQLQQVSPPQTPVEAAQRDIERNGGVTEVWKEGKNAPQAMSRGAVVVRGNTVYFRPADANQIFAYEAARLEPWSRLTDNTNQNCGLAVVEGVLTSVGGITNGSTTNTLLSLTGEGERKQWSEIFPPMPTPRGCVACVTTQRDLVAVGGTDAVEIMDLQNKLWSAVSPLPRNYCSLSAAVCGDKLYLAGGSAGSLFFGPSKSVFSCSLQDLVMSSNTFGSRVQRALSSRNVWKQVYSLPVKQSTLVSCGEDLLAVGGSDDSNRPTYNVYRYDPQTNRWVAHSQMKIKKYLSLSACLPNNSVIVVGGITDEKNGRETNCVELFQQN